MPIARETARFPQHAGAAVAHATGPARRRSRPATDHTATDPARLAAMPIEEIWSLFRRNPAHQLRNFLIEHWRHLAITHARRIHKRLPSHVDVDDIISSADLGLMQAIERFDPARGVKFETFSANHIIGAIFDELRARDWVPRLVRDRAAKFEKARHRLEQRLGHPPTEDEISEELCVSPEEAERIIRDSRPVSVGSLERRCNRSDDSGREVRQIDVIRDDSQLNPLVHIQADDLKRLLTKGFSRADQLIIVLYYYERLSMKEIGAVLDLSESRVSQLHSSILAQLKAQLQHREREFEPVAPY